MTDYLPLIAAALIGVLVPACTRWLWRKIEQPLTVIGARIGRVEDKQEAQEARLHAHDVEIAYLKGVQSERSQTAAAAVTAAALVGNLPLGHSGDGS